MRTSILNGKKGNAFLDTVSIVVIIFIFGIISIFAYSILKDVNTDIQAGSEFSPNAKAKMDNLTTNYPVWMDYAFLTAFVLLWIASIVFSFMVDSHPIFLVITIILLVFVMLFAGILTNTYEELSQEADFEVNSFPITNYILSNLLLMVLFIGASISLALYGKTSIGSGGF